MFTRWLIKKLGGFTDIEDYLDTIDSFEQRNKILTRAVKRLYSTISDDDILKEHESGQWLFMGKPINEQEKQLLIAETKQLLNSKLWKVLQVDVKYQANKKMYLLAEDALQITAGKLWLYTLDCFDTRLKSLEKGTGYFNKK